MAASEYGLAFDIGTACAKPASIAAVWDMAAQLCAHKSPVSSFVLFAQILLVSTFLVFVIATCVCDSGAMSERAVAGRKPRRWLRRPRRTLTSEILSLQLGIILAALVVGVIASWLVARARVDDEYGHRALSIAQSVAAVPTVTNALTGAGAPADVQPLAESVRHSSG